MDGCQEFEDDLHAVPGRERVDAERQRRFEEHLAFCADCRAVQQQEEWLSRALAEMNEQDGVAAPADLHMRLRSEFESHHAARRHGRKMVAAAAAVVLLSAAALIEKQRQSAREPNSSLTVAGSVSQTGSEPDDFVPLPFASPLGRHEHVDVYRVRLPEHALSSFGLKAKVSHSGALLTADIVVGEDGVARGIRVFHKGDY